METIYMTIVGKILAAESDNNSFTPPETAKKTGTQQAQRLWLVRPTLLNTWSLLLLTNYCSKHNVVPHRYLSIFGDESKFTFTLHLSVFNLTCCGTRYSMLLRVKIVKTEQCIIHFIHLTVGLTVGLHAIVTEKWKITLSAIGLLTAEFIRVCKRNKWRAVAEQTARCRSKELSIQWAIRFFLF